MKIEYLIDAMRNQKLGPDDVRLIAIFDKHRDELSELIDECLPDEAYLREHNLTFINAFVPIFHKAFRQRRIVTTAADNRFIWDTLAKSSSCFYITLYRLYGDD